MDLGEEQYILSKSLGGRNVQTFPRKPGFSTFLKKFSDKSFFVS